MSRNLGEADTRGENPIINPKELKRRIGLVPSHCGRPVVASLLRRGLPRGTPLTKLKRPQRAHDTRTAYMYLGRYLPTYLGNVLKVHLEAFSQLPLF